MKKILSLLSLAALTVGLLGSCSKIDERISNLEKRIDGIEATSIASVQQQIDGIKASITKLEAADVTVNGKIDELKATAETHQTLIDALKEADKALGQKDDALEARIATLEGQVATINGQIKTLEDADKAINDRIDELKTYVDTEIGKTKDWAKETFATLEQYQKTADDLAALSVTVTGISTTLAGVQTSIAGLDTKINGINTTLEGKIASAKTELEGKITGLKTELEDKIATAIRASETSIKTWINELLEGYYTIAQVDAKIGSLNTAIETAKSTSKTRIDSVATELTALKKVVDTEKATIRTEYKEAIKVAIDSLDGEIRGALLDSIAAVNGRIEALDTRVTTLEGKVLALEGNVNKLLAMIQAVTIIPAYTDGSVEAVDGTLTIDFVVSPAAAVKGVTKDSIKVLVCEAKVKTKAASYTTLDAASATVDETTGNVTITADISAITPAEGKGLTVAVNVKNGISDFTTEFVPVYVASAKPIAEYVEIGGVKWATKNLGAEKETDYGYYFAWGATELAYSSLSSKTFTFVASRPASYGGSGWTQSSGFAIVNTPYYNGSAYTKYTDSDSKTVLESSDDAATALLGSGWRMPTTEEFQALYNACLNGSYDTSTNPSGASASVGKGVYWCTSYDGVAGCLFCDGTNKLFFPAAGYGNGTSFSDAGIYSYYWSSSLYTDYTNYAHYSFFGSDEVAPKTNYDRSRGFSVRPVKDAAKPLPTGALAGEFTVAEGKKVHFSKGNLQATYSTSTSSYTWGFATNQYAYIGNAAGNTTIDSQTDGAVVDLFGWSTDATSNNWGIHTKTSATDGFTSGDFKDWGEAYCESNSIAEGTWRTLSSDEWTYLFNTRTVNGGKGAGKSYSLNITYGGKMGVVLYPDGYTGSVLSGTVDSLPEGVVFLPAAGYRSSAIYDVGTWGYYWSSTEKNDYNAYYLVFCDSIFNPASSAGRGNGYSVRLVTEVK